MTNEYYIIKENIEIFGDMYYGEEESWLAEIKKAKEFPVKEIAEFFIQNKKLNARVLKVRASFEFIEETNKNNPVPKEEW